MAQTKLSTLRARVGVAPLRMTKMQRNAGTSSAYDTIEFIAPNGRTLFSVNVEDLFDADGNRFEDDLT